MSPGLPHGFSRDEGGRALLGAQRLQDLLDRGLETPAYVYDLDGMADAARRLGAAFGDAPHLVAYAVKANTAGPVVRALVAAGCGCDVVSGGELEVALGAGASPEQVVMSGVAKRDDELDRAIAAGSRGILAVQLESVEEIARVAARAATAGRRVRVSVRVNPGVEVDTHAHVATGHDEAKFGVALADLADALTTVDAHPSLELAGLSCHVGSQLMAPEGWLLAAERLCDAALASEARRGRLAFLDFGGGFGIDYGGSSPQEPAAFARAGLSLLREKGLAGRTLVVEPGRALVAAFGVLLARVIQTKRASDPDRGGAGAGGRRWLLLDAGMNDLVRPALYQAKHRIEPLAGPTPAAGPGAARFRVVGPVCESSDDFGEHLLPEPAPSAVAIRDAGAYGFTMASEYNGRGLAAEVFLRAGEPASVIRSRDAGAWARARLAAPEPLAPRAAPR